METIKANQSKKYDKVMYWGMRVTPEEKQAIKILSQTFNRPASRIILDLVNKALTGVNIKEPNIARKKLTIDELMALPKNERDKIVKQQTKKIAKEYEKDIIHYNEDITED